MPLRSLQSITLTGGAGFIGSALARALLKRDEVEKLIILDKLTYAGNLKNLADIDQDPRLHFIEGDILDEKLVSQLLTAHSCTGVFNLAAESHVDRSITDPSHFFSTNIIGAARIAEIARTLEIPLLQCSTDEVYGSVERPLQLDETANLAPSSPYSASKCSADLILQAAHTTHGQDVVIARCTNNYGPRQHREKLIPTLVYHALKDQNLPIYGSGKQVRDWIHVEDCALGLIQVFEKASAGRVYHIGANNELTNLEIAHLVLEKLNKPKSLIKHVSDRLGHDTRYALDTDRARTELGWQAEIDFHQEIQNVISELSSSLLEI